jgi:hypothetical protein
MKWEPGSNVIGDFTWPGFNDDMVVTLDAGRRLAERFARFDLSPVEMIPGESTSREAPCVSLPYEGPPLRDLFVTASVPFDSARSTFDEDGTPVGVGRYEFTVDPQTRRRTIRRVARVPGRGVFVRGRDIEGLDIFKVQSWVWNFCTDRVRDFVLEAGFSNVDFHEVGEII